MVRLSDIVDLELENPMAAVIDFDLRTCKPEVIDLESFDWKLVAEDEDDPIDEEWDEDDWDEDEDDDEDEEEEEEDWDEDEADWDDDDDWDDE